MLACDLETHLLGSARAQGVPPDRYIATSATTFLPAKSFSSELAVTGRVAWPL